MNVIKWIGIRGKNGPPAFLVVELDIEGMTHWSWRNNMNLDEVVIEMNIKLKWQRENVAKFRLMPESLEF